MSNVLQLLRDYDSNTYTHCVRVGQVSSEIVAKLGGGFADVSRMNSLGVYHDIGKLGIDTRLLNKRGKLTDYEYSIVKKHALLCYDYLQGVMDEPQIHIISLHHRTLEQAGYPYEGTFLDVPIESSILHLADSFDAMTSTRGYNRPMSKHEAIREFFTLDMEYPAYLVKALAKTYF